jgi:hypothetical protein
MTRERSHLETHEQRLAIYERDGGICVHCGHYVSINDFQIAHRIARTKWAIKLYGLDVIEHIDNKACTHPGSCRLQTSQWSAKPSRKRSEKR